MMTEIVRDAMKQAIAKLERVYEEAAEHGWNEDLEAEEMALRLEIRMLEEAM